MKARNLIMPIAVVLLLLMVTTPLASAQGGEGGASWASPSYSTWLMIQNLGDSEATVTIQLYDTSGTLHQTISDIKIAAGSLYYVNPDTDISGDNFRGSAVVSSDQPIDAVVTIYDYNLSLIHISEPTRPY